MEQKKMVKKTNRKGISVLAAAVLTASLLGGQVYPVTASAEYGTTITKGSLIPDNVTISEPVALSEVSLPGSEYGTLTWADEAFVPSEHVQSCEVIFTPSGKADVSGVSGYDKETGTVIGYVNVVVSSLAEQEEEYEESPEENQDQDTETEEPEITETPEAEETPEGEVPEATVTPGATVTPEVTEAPEKEEPEVSVTPEATVTPEAEENPEEEPQVSATPEATVTPEAEETPDEEEPEATITPEATVTPEATPTPEITENPEEEDDNIFDRPQDPSEEEQDRPSDMEENLTEQEMAEMAEQNHTCNGISVSGINLPWYVQFRATSGESYDFTNEEDAAIFKSYEFELWDLKNNTEYTIPDGQYISVTVPVKDGYDYSVEHLLDNGAMETIIPNVEDGVMVFSTHSFSPFGIAGSKPIVDNGIAEDGYGGNAEPTKAPETTKTPEATKTPSSDGKDQGTSDNTGENTSVQSQTDKTETNRNTDSKTETDENTNTSDSKKSVNTGDSTVILPFVILVAAAVIVVGVVLYLKKNRK